MFKQIKNQKVYLQILNQIKNSIRHGDLKIGDRLPSEREMSKQLNVARPTIREAIRSLEIMGLVKCLHGDGNFITDDIENSLIEPMSIMFMLSGRPPTEITELRCALELESVKLASKKINDSSLKRMEELCVIIESNAKESVRSTADSQFHYEIAKASNNILIINILNATRALFRSLMKELRILAISHGEDIRLLDAQHRYILNALKDRNTKEALHHMQEHMEVVIRYTKKMVSLQGGEQVTKPTTD